MALKQKKNRKREKYEESNRGGFELIYPIQSEQKMAKYDQFLEAAQQVINEHHGTVKKLNSTYLDKETVSTNATISGSQASGRNQN